MVRKRVLIGLPFLVGGFLALIKTWSENIPTLPNPPPTLDVETFWNFILTTGIEATVIVIGMWLVASGLKSNSSS